MNPFIESTVARPLSQDHHDHRWVDTPVTSGHSPLPQPAAGGPGIAADARKVVTDGDSNDGHASQPPISTDRPNTPVKSVLTILGLCFTLTMSGLSGAGANPAFMAGIVALAGSLVPRSVQAVDLNRATAQELQTVRGIGPKTARTIINERTRGGDYESFTDLSDRVKGIGPKKASALQAAGLTLAAGAAPTQSVGPTGGGKKR